MEVNTTDSKKKSIVWEHFTLETLSPGCVKAHCKHCGRSLAYVTDSKQVGTSHLRRHISSAICQKSQQIPYSKDAAAYPPKKQATGREAPCVAACTSFDNKECCNNDIAKMIILHDYPLHLVEHPGFVDFVQTLQPQFNLPSFNAVEGECVAMYHREKQNLLKLINGIPGRVNLTLDLWTSNQTLAYVFVRGHFIDGDWNLHHPILNVMMVPCPDSYNSLNQAIGSCLSDWHLEGRLYPTANLFFPAVSKLHVELTHATFSQDLFCRNLIKPLQVKFDQYWRESWLILAVAVAMDPRHKMKLVETTFAKVFGENGEVWIRNFEVGLHELFLEHIIQMLPPSISTNGDEGNNEAMIKTEACQEGSLDGSLFAAEDGLFDIGCYISEFTDNQKFNSELNEYLEEPLEPSVQEFDILSWWRVKGLKYPTLSRMASDILSMPVSTLFADSVFDTQLRKMDRYRSSIRPSTLEALICAKDWYLHRGPKVQLTHVYNIA